MQRARPTAVVNRVLPNAISAVPIDRTRVARRTRLRRRRERERQRPVTGRKTLLADYVAIVPHAYCTADRPPRTTRPGRSSRGTSFRCIPERTEAPDARSREASPATRHRKDTLPPLQVTSPPETYRTGCRRFRSSIRHCCRYACGCRDNRRAGNRHRETSCRRGPSLVRRAPDTVYISQPLSSPTAVGDHLSPRAIQRTLSPNVAKEVVSACLVRNHASDRLRPVTVHRTETLD